MPRNLKSPTDVSPPSSRANRRFAGRVRRPRRAHPGGFAAILFIGALLVAFSGCDLPTTTTAGLALSTSTPATSSGTPATGLQPISTATATNPKTPTPKPTLNPKSATPTPQALTLAGAPAMVEVAQSTTLNSASNGSVTATCPAGDYALGGGWSVPPTIFAVSAAKMNGASWTVSMRPLGHPALSHTTLQTITAYVECFSGATGAVVTQRGRTVTEPPTPAADILASPCLAGEAPIGFGFDFNGAGAEMEFAGAYPFVFDGTTEWNFHVINHDTVSHPVSVYIECLANVSLPKVPGHPALGSVNVSVFESFPQKDGGPVSAGSKASLQEPCPTGTLLAAGGMDYPSGGSGNLFLMQATSGGWQGGVYALSGSTGLSLLEEAICISFS